MTAIEFNSLPTAEQLQLLLDKAQYMAHTQYYNQDADLYSLDSLFIEVISISPVEIASVAVVSEDLLNKYLGDIKLFF